MLCQSVPLTRDAIRVVYIRQIKASNVGFARGRMNGPFRMSRKTLEVARQSEI